MDFKKTLPDPDEIEFTIFGPGYGEAIILHLGENNWMLVDSCLFPKTKDKEPISLYYLNQIGVDPSSVQTIVASHWHDDHIRGLSALVRKYDQADFFMSGIFNDREMLDFLAAYDDVEGVGRGTKELTQCIQSSHNPKFAIQRVELYDKMIGSYQIKVMAFSPTSNAQIQSKIHYAKYLPGQGKGRVSFAPDLMPNIEAVVIHVDLDGEAILLGSDLENHQAGWQAVISDSMCLSKTPASVYKVAHHGSISGDHPDIWNKLLKDKPYVSLTPFIRGDKNLPTDEDRERLREKSKYAFISSGKSRKPKMDYSIEKRLSDMCKNLSLVNPGFGGIRFRKKLGSVNWNKELIGDADMV
jgi:hypothetical protein